MFKRGISLVILIITIVLIIILTSTVIYIGTDLFKETEQIKIEKIFTLLEKNIRKEYINGNTVGVNLESYYNNKNNEQKEFTFTVEELEEKIKDITERHLVLILNKKSDYYLLNKNHIKSLKLDELLKLSDNFLVNYKNGYVFLLNPIKDENNNKIYTVQKIMSFEALVQGYPIELNSLKENVINYKIYGNSIQNGTPNLNNKIPIESLGDKTVNLIKYPFDNFSSNINGINFFNNADGSITVDGTSKSEEKTIFYLLNEGSVSLTPGTYTLSTNCYEQVEGVNLVIGGENSVFNQLIDINGFEKTFTIETKGDIGIIGIQVDAGVTVSNLTFKPQLQIGENATEYEPYGKYKIPMIVNDRTINIFLDEPLRKIDGWVDYIDFSAQQVIRNIHYEKITKITSTSSLAGTYKRFLGKVSYKPYIIIDGANTNYTKGYAMSDSFKRNIKTYYDLGDNSNIIQTYITTGGVNCVAFSFDDTSINTIALAQNKIGEGFYVQYVMNSKIVQNIELPELILDIGVNNITLGTSVQPSNMEIEYYKK